MLYRLIPPQWLKEERPDYQVLEGRFTKEEIDAHNANGYNCYLLPNYPSEYDPNRTVNGSDIDSFNYVFADMDLKDKLYPDKQTFIDRLYSGDVIEPSLIVDSGNGVHAYWEVSDLDAMSFLRLQRRICRKLQTDDAVSKLYQLMRCPNTMNTKDKSHWKQCETVKNSGKVYTCEELDAAFPPISQADEAYCQQHYDRTYGLNQKTAAVDDTIPLKFTKLLRENPEVKEIWSGGVDDRSKADYRLGHIMHAQGFTRDEAVSTLVNTGKALQRAPIHRIGYAEGIVDKIWTFEATEDKTTLDLSSSVKDILQRADGALEGTRLPCYKYIDNTAVGFRLGHVMGLVAGSGVGKTAVALNLFLGFVDRNPDFVHFFCPLEQPAREIAARWKLMCGDNENLHSKVHILSNYDDNGNFRDLSLATIKEYIMNFQKVTGKKVGCIVIDHIGVLCNNNKLGQDEGVKQLAKAMKGFAMETKTFLIMQSQTAREKAGIGDLELNKDAAFGTSVFENFCDYLVTLWQPLKRCYAEGAPAVTAFKFCKIRHKKKHLDKIQEDVRYKLVFDPGTELLREFTQAEEESFSYWNQKSTNIRKQDRKTDVLTYQSVDWTGEANGEVNNS